MSVVTDFFSKITPSKLLLLYLFLSGKALGAEAADAASIKRTFYAGGTKKILENLDACVAAAPDCLLSVKFATTGYNVEQECAPSGAHEMHSKWNIGKQPKEGVFIGEELCEQTLRSLDGELLSKLKACHSGNSEHALDLSGRGERITATCRPR